MMRMICKKGYPWEAYCAKIQNEKTQRLRKSIDNHICSEDYKFRFLTSKWLSSKIQTNVRQNPNLKLTDIRKKTQQKLNTVINKTLAYREKAMNIDIVGVFQGEIQKNL